MALFHHSRILPLLIAALALAGCSSVSSVHPIGSPLTADQTNSARAIEGTWMKAGEDASIIIKLLDGGDVRVASTQWKDDHFETEEMSAKLGSVGDAIFINLIDKDSESKEYGFVLLARCDEHDLMVLPPDVESFEKAVNAGELKGTVDKKEHGTAVHLTGDKADLDAYFTKERIRLMFPAEEALLLRRVGNPPEDKGGEDEGK